MEFNGQTVRAVPVRDRIGLEGDPTLHFVSPEGKYLGSVTPATGVTIVATDSKTLSKLWPDAVIARPHVLDAPPEPPEN